MLRVLDLFSGIGGFSLGLERTGGFRTVAFCEIEPFCRRVLAKHWPEVPCYDDVRTLSAERLAADGIAVDVICGGFPCQDISTAGKGAGITGERSGLWSEYARIIGELRPQFVIVENVAALLSRGLDKVLGDLAALGFDAEWHCIPAAAVGAPHRRDRVWILAYHDDRGRRWQNPADEEFRFSLQGGRTTFCDVRASGVADSVSAGCARPRQTQSEERRHNSLAPWRGAALADSQCGRLQGGHVKRAEPSAIIAPAFGRGIRRGEFGETWRTEPNVGRVAYGLPAQLDRLRGLGNAVVPQIPELIGNAILAALQQAEAA